MSNDDQQLETIEAVESLEWDSDDEYNQWRDSHYTFHEGMTDWFDRDYDNMREEMEDE